MLPVLHVNLGEEGVFNHYVCLVELLQTGRVDPVEGFLCLGCLPLAVLSLIVCLQGLRFLIQELWVLIDFRLLTTKGSCP